MSTLTRSTVKLLCARSDNIRTETLNEAQRLLDLYFDPKVSPVEKELAKVELDRIIQEIEERVTTRRLRQAEAKHKTE